MIRAVAVTLAPPPVGQLAPKWRATYVVHTNLMAEGNGLRISAVLTADTDLQSRTSASSPLNPDFHQLSNAFFVQYLNGSFHQNAFFNIFRRKGNHVIAAKTKGHLGKVMVPKEKNSACLAILSAIAPPVVIQS